MVYPAEFHSYTSILNEAFRRKWTLGQRIPVVSPTQGSRMGERAGPPRLVGDILSDSEAVCHKLAR